MKRNSFLLLLIAFISLTAFAQVGHKDSLNNTKGGTGAVISRDSLQKIIRQQNEDIAKFKALQEDMTAKEVFEKSKSYLIWWISSGGIIILIVSIFGISKIKDYIIDVLKKKIEAEGSIKIDEYIQQNIPIDKIVHDIGIKGNEKLTELLNENKKSFDELVSKGKKDFQDFSKQLEDSRQALKKPTGGIAFKENARLEEQAPTEIDYSSLMTPVRSQGELGANIGFALAYSMEYLIMKQLNEKVILSPLFIYYEARKVAGNEKIDAGAFLPDAIKVGQTIGFVLEKNWPYKIKDFAKAPPKTLDSTPHYFIGDVAPIKNISQIKEALANYGPPIIGVSVYHSIFSAANGVIKMPAHKETSVGSMALCLTGFDDKTRLFKFQHSWGEEWGDKGYGYIPYDYVEKFSGDNWAIKSVSTKEAK